MVTQLRAIAPSVIRPLVTIDAVQCALSDQLSNAETNVLSMGIDDYQQRSRIDLVFENVMSIAASTLALMAAQILHRSFGQALGALRIDVYCRVGSEAMVLVATHHDSFDTSRRSA